MDPGSMLSMGVIPTADDWAMLEEWGASAGAGGGGAIFLGAGMFSPVGEIGGGGEEGGGGKAPPKSRSKRARKPSAARADEDQDWVGGEEGVAAEAGSGGGGGGGGVKRMTRNKNANSANAAKHSSLFRGVTKHRWTGRFEAHLWDSTVARGPSAAGTKRPRGRQIYLGALLRWQGCSVARAAGC